MKVVRWDERGKKLEWERAGAENFKVQGSFMPFEAHAFIRGRQMLSDFYLPSSSDKPRIFWKPEKE